MSHVCLSVTSEGLLVQKCEGTTVLSTEKTRKRLGFSRILHHILILTKLGH